MKQLWSRYVAGPFRRTMISLPWFGPVISAVLVALTVNVLSQALFAWGGMWLPWVFVLLLLGAAVAFVWMFQANEGRRRKAGLGLGPVDVPNPSKYRGLIFLFSREDTFREAIQYHQPVLKNCWLIVTPEYGANAKAAAERFSDVHFDLREIDNLYDTVGCYGKVREIYEHEALACGLAPQQIISDITGGTKPMTMGMILACLEGGFAIEHVPTHYVEGKATGPLPPIEIRVQRGQSKES